MSARSTYFASAAVAMSMWNAAGTLTTLTLSLWLPTAIGIAALNWGTGSIMWIGILLLAALPVLRLPAIVLKLYTVNGPSSVYAPLPLLIRLLSSSLHWLSFVCHLVPSLLLLSLVSSLLPLLLGDQAELTGTCPNEGDLWGGNLPAVLASPFNASEIATSTAATLVELLRVKSGPLEGWGFVQTSPSTACWNIGAVYIYISAFWVVCQGAIRWNFGGQADILNPPTAWRRLGREEPLPRPVTGIKRLAVHWQPAFMTGLEDAFRAMLVLTPLTMLGFELVVFALTVSWWYFFASLSALLHTIEKVVSLQQVASSLQALVGSLQFAEASLIVRLATTAWRVVVTPVGGAASHLLQFLYSYCPPSLLWAPTEQLTVSSLLLWIFTIVRLVLRSAPAALLLVPLLSVLSAWESVVTLLQVARRNLSVQDVIAGIPFAPIAPVQVKADAITATLPSAAFHPDCLTAEGYGLGKLEIDTIDLRIAALECVPQKSLNGYLVAYPIPAQLNVSGTSKTQAMGGAVAGLRPGTALLSKGRSGVMYVFPPQKLLHMLDVARRKVFGTWNPDGDFHSYMDKSWYQVFVSPLVACMEMVVLACFRRQGYRFASSTIAGTELQSFAYAGSGAAQSTSGSIESAIAEQLVADLNSVGCIAVGPAPPLPVTRLSTALLSQQQEWVAAWQARLMCGEFAVCAGDVSVLGGIPHHPLDLISDNLSSVTAQLVDSSLSIHSVAESASRALGNPAADELLYARVVQSLASQAQSGADLIRGGPLSATSAPILCLRDSILRPTTQASIRDTDALEGIWYDGRVQGGALNVVRTSSDMVIAQRGARGYRQDAFFGHASQRSIVDEFVEPIVAPLARLLIHQQEDVGSGAFSIAPPHAPTALHKALRDLRAALVIAGLLPQSAGAQQAFKEWVAPPAPRPQPEAATPTPVRKRRRGSLGITTPRSLIGFDLDTSTHGSGVLQQHKTTSSSTTSGQPSRADPNSGNCDAYILQSVRPQRLLQRSPSLLRADSEAVTTVFSRNEYTRLLADATGRSWNKLFWASTASIDSLTIALSIAAGTAREPSSMFTAKAAMRDVEAQLRKGSPKGATDAVAGAKVDVFNKPTSQQPRGQSNTVPASVENSKRWATRAYSVLAPFANAWLNALSLLFVQPLHFIYQELHEKHTMKYKLLVDSYLAAFARQLAPYDPLVDNYLYRVSADANVHQQCATEAGVAPNGQLVEVSAKAALGIWEICGAVIMDAQHAQMACNRIQRVLSPYEDAAQQPVVGGAAGETSRTASTRTTTSSADFSPATYRRCFYVNSTDAWKAVAISAAFVFLPLLYMSYHFADYIPNVPLLGDRSDRLFALIPCLIAYSALVAVRARPYRLKVNELDDVTALAELATIALANDAQDLLHARIEFVDHIPYAQRVVGIVVRSLQSIFGVPFAVAELVFVIVRMFLQSSVGLVVIPLARSVLVHRTSLVWRIGVDVSRLLTQAASWLVASALLFPWTVAKVAAPIIARLFEAACRCSCRVVGRNAPEWTAASDSGMMDEFERPLPTVLAAVARSPADISASILADHRATEAAIEMLVAVVEESRQHDAFGVVQQTLPALIASFSGCLVALAGYLSSHRYVSTALRSRSRDSLLDEGSQMLTSSAWGDSSAVIEFLRSFSGRTRGMLVHDEGSGVTTTVDYARPAIASLQHALCGGLVRISNAFPQHYDDIVAALPSPALSTAALAAVSRTATSPQHRER